MQQMCAQLQSRARYEATTSRVAEGPIYVRERSSALLLEAGMGRQPQGGDRQVWGQGPRGVANMDIPVRVMCAVESM